MNKKRALAEPPPAPRACSLSANIGLTTEYVFRGYSQTAEGAAVQGGFDATCGLFYAGVWASNLDWGNNGGGTTANNAEYRDGLVRRHQAEDRPRSPGISA